MIDKEKLALAVKEQPDTYLRELAEQFERELGEISEETDIIYIDESGVQKEMNPTRGRAKRGVSYEIEPVINFL